ncbi:MAG: ATP-binding protein [candidate division WOR-3 bacterium]
MLDLITFNRWWDTSRVDDYYLKHYKRNLFKRLVDYLGTRQILVIYGLRRTGKTTLMYQLIDYLLKKGIPPKHILYFSFDEKVSNLKELFKIYSETIVSKELSRLKNVYIFLDEIQKLENWENQLKIFYDLYPNLKFIISGSASITIQTRATETLAGRIYDFILTPLSFKEFLTLKNEPLSTEIDNIFDMKQLKSVFLSKNRILPYLIEFAKKGGFIELIDEESEQRIKDYARSIVERVSFVDLTGVYRIRYPQHLKTILELIAANPGLLLDYASLSKTLNRDQRVIADYISYLKYTFLIKSLYNYSKSRFVSERKLKKIYLGSTNFIYGFYADKFNEPDFWGRVMENLLVVNTDTEFFWRQRNYEIDLILKDNIPLELKYQDRINNDDIKPIIKFCKKYKIKRALILTHNFIDSSRIENIEIFFIPLWLYLLTK